MSELYDRYVSDKKPAEIIHRVVTDIYCDKLSRHQTDAIISELDINGVLNDVVIKTSPKSEWSEDYLELLVNKAVTGTFSKQYLLHLAEVAEYVNENEKKDIKKRQNNKIAAIVIGIIAVIIFVALIIPKG